MKTTDLIIKHLKALISKYKVEIDLLMEMKKKKTNELHQAEIDINITDFEEQIKEIQDIVDSLERSPIYISYPEENSILLSPSATGRTMSIEQTNLTDFTIQKLKNYEINTVPQLLSMSKEDLKKYRNLGNKVLNEIEEFKKNYNNK